MNEEMLRSLITTYRKDVWSPFTKAVRDYQLIKENDRIAVCISGGKDSFMLALVLEELRRHGEVPFELVYLCLDPG
ncbi:MAG: tRNA 2-thiocytidine biosynthesis protein TtcA, partial [Erysipelotrichales bacterium]|nr:tRNA 2-thiocytidine biosynthesis protein TtcA [Erysipelotrichales bacterium]